MKTGQTDRTCTMHVTRYVHALNETSVGYRLDENALPDPRARGIENMIGTESLLASLEVSVKSNITSFVPRHTGNDIVSRIGRIVYEDH